MSIQDTLLSSIETMIRNTTPKYVPQSDYACVIKSIRNGKYEVVINGGTYFVTNGVGVKLKIGSAVWVHVPNQNFSKAFIIGTQGGSVMSSGGDSYFSEIYTDTMPTTGYDGDIVLLKY